MTQRPFSMRRILLHTAQFLVFAATPVLAQSTAPLPVVHAVMFWKAGCGHCEETISVTLPPIHEKYGEQFNLLLVEIASMQDVDGLYTLAAAYGIPNENVGVPFLVLDGNVLVGSDQIHQQLSELIDDYLARGGVGLPENAALRALVPGSAPLADSPTPTLSDTPLNIAQQAGPGSAQGVRPEPVAVSDSGFTLAIIIMVGMVIVLLYSLITFALGKAFPLTAWADWLIPVLIVIGIGVAGYLSYVETQAVTAMCGPVGDCNAVQSSRYAKLFGVLPVGVLGLLGYLGLLATWLVRRLFPTLEKLAALGFLGMAFFAVAFSLYLTYLEPFVIGAVCIWCLSSAILVTILLLLGLPPAVRVFSTHDDKDAE
jgi:uncharacterized membrane protein